MKEGMAMRGIFKSALVRPPVLKPSPEEIEAMRRALRTSGVPTVDLG
jgi:dihydrodipicolinate synthase/N-acetylneuraminate lyase